MLIFSLLRLCQGNQPYELYRLLHPIAPIKIIFVSWNGGIIENHVQIFTKYTGIPLFLDPTIGLIAKATFNQVASGHKIPSAEMINFYSRNDIDTFFIPSLEV